MAGRIEIGYVVAEYTFGVSAAKVIGVILSLLLVSTISAMLLAGPRALYVIGRDFSAFRWLGQENRYSVPANAVVLQITLTLLLIVTSTFDSIIIFSGAILAPIAIAASAIPALARRRGGGAARAPRRLAARAPRRFACIT